MEDRELQSALWKSEENFNQHRGRAALQGRVSHRKESGALAPRGLLLLSRPEIERRRIHAIPQARRRRTVIKHVPQVRIARGAANLGPHHAVGRILVLDHAATRDRLGEARPARPGIKLRLRIKQRSPTAHAVVHPRILRVPVRPGKGTLGARLARHVILLRREFLLPLRFCLHNLLGNLLSHDSTPFH